MGGTERFELPDQPWEGSEGLWHSKPSLTTERLLEKKTYFASSQSARQVRNKGVGGAQHLQVDEKAACWRRQKHPSES
jgi:hypothetical protein